MRLSLRLTAIVALAANAVSAAAIGELLENRNSRDWGFDLGFSFKDQTNKQAECPATLTKPYLVPKQIVPIAASQPDKAFGDTGIALISPGDFCSIFNLYVPASAHNKTCTLKFLFPDQAQLPHSSYFYSGPGHFTFTGYAFGVGADSSTTFNHQPPAGPSPPTPPSVLSPGHAYTVNVGDCGVAANQPGGYLEVSGALCSTDTWFSYYQTDAICPIGFFVEIS